MRKSLLRESAVKSRHENGQVFDWQEVTESESREGGVLQGGR